MSFQAKDSTVTFNWAIAPNASPPVKADFDVTLVLPNGNVTYTDDGITTYVAPTAIAQGLATYELTLALLGRYQVTLSIGTSAAHIISAHREIYSVIPPAYVIEGADIENGGIQTTQGPDVIPPIDTELYTVTQGLTTFAGNDYWGFTTRTSPFGPFGSINRDQINGETIISLYFFDSATAGTGFLLGISGDHTSSGDDFLFTSLTPEDSIILTPADLSNFVYDSGADETEWIWHTNTTPALVIPPLWDGIEIANVVIVPV